IALDRVLRRHRLTVGRTRSVAPDLILWSWARRAGLDQLDARLGRARLLVLGIARGRALRRAICPRRSIRAAGPIRSVRPVRSVRPASAIRATSLVRRLLSGGLLRRGERLAHLLEHATESAFCRGRR